ncbi:alkaline shock response membrane anchor protein AmaP [Tepidanaerobacter sp. EBM-38]|uniref:alkaline shock response membrane anchor protein AmaP n=1 Tax=Tepidanaerobacter sp. EBM-38 TaxID=1918496 RepID=UPI000B0E1881|nr:alkaline shock response membrane anchor protein AmaP [Tepidanaerobacter sp. EBM-38]
MNLFDRIILAIYALFFSLLSIVLILFSIKIVSFQYVITSLSILYGRWETCAIGLVLLLISLRFLFYGLKSNRVSETTVKDSELGKVCITLDAIENLALKVIRDIENIKDSKIKVKKQENGVSILLKLTVNYDVIIPEMTLELQKTIKDYIETTAGISVNDIQISIDNISNQPKQKVAK